MSITIWHNPACSTSRNVLAMIREAGTEPRVIEYLKHPPTRAELSSVLARMGVDARMILRRRGTPYDELDLGRPTLTEDELLDAMIAHPVLIERPIVFTANDARLCRPAEVVRELLAQGWC